jgi:hypothetical protein
MAGARKIDDVTEFLRASGGTQRAVSELSLHTLAGKIYVSLCNLLQEEEYEDA